MIHIEQSDKLKVGMGVLFSLLVVFGWYQGIVKAPADFQQGEVYRIIYLHVPVAAAALILGGIGLLVVSLFSLVKLTEHWLIVSRSCCEVSLLFTILTLFSGSIWGYPTWGTFWTWDPRLTTTFVLFILLVAYLMLYASLGHGKLRIRACAVLGILIAVDVPIIYKSVAWWNSLHQPASLIAERGKTMAPEMLSVLLFNIGAILLMASLLWVLRFRTMKLQHQLEEQAFRSMLES